jgi:hypothetical protein
MFCSLLVPIRRYLIVLFNAVTQLVSVPQQYLRVYLACLGNSTPLQCPLRRLDGSWYKRFLELFQGTASLNSLGVIGIALPALLHLVSRLNPRDTQARKSDMPMPQNSSSIKESVTKSGA